MQVLVGGSVEQAAGLRARAGEALRRYGAAQEEHAVLLLAVQIVFVALLACWLVASHTWPAPDLIVAGLLVSAILSARGLRFLRDWTPLLLLTLAYVALPGVTPGLLQRVHIGFPIAVDTWLGFGKLPTLRLQGALWDPNHLHWYDYATAFLYLMHFLVPLALAYLLWLRSRPLYQRFLRSYLLLMYAGFATYLLFPMAPPWWAAEHGRIGAVQPVLASVNWQGVGNPVVLLSRFFQTDPIAAMPSIHAAFPMLVFLVLRRLSPRWGWFAALYPVAMALAVIYAGEHYLVDVLAGFLYAAVAYNLVWNWSSVATRLRPVLAAIRRALHPPIGVQPASGHGQVRHRPARSNRRRPALVPVPVRHDEQPLPDHLRRSHDRRRY